jgi:formylglycine-generating enzyme
MNRIKNVLLILLISSASPLVMPVMADTFGSGANSFDIDFVTIVNPNNPPDTNPNPAGAVPYEYRIGKYEISEQMIDKANLLGGLGITKDSRGPDYPATSVTWFEAAKFVNWLNTSTGGHEAYKFDASGNFQLWQSTDAGYDANNYRNKLAKYFLPTVHEWHKAAYYNPSTGTYFNYPTGSNSVPDGIDSPGDTIFDAVFFDGGLNPDPNIVTNVGLLSPYGTAGQGGNVEEWEETAFDWQNTSAAKSRVIQGGGWGSTSSSIQASNSGGGMSPSTQSNSIGFRIAGIIPEPSTFALVYCGFIGLLGFTRRRPISRRDIDARLSNRR